jgi:hypothetical protein
MLAACMLALWWWCRACMHTCMHGCSAAKARKLVAAAGHNCRLHGICVQASPTLYAMLCGHWQASSSDVLALPVCGYPHNHTMATRFRCCKHTCYLRWLSFHHFSPTFQPSYGSHVNLPPAAGLRQCYASCSRVAAEAQQLCSRCTGLPKQRHRAA